ncbi:MAG: cell division protein ZapA [Bacteroidales bacterium]|nr:cell division protein ZapA [Bacteroidales bacterium]
MNEITINVSIADRPYKITIKRDDEELIRLAVKDINDKIKSFSQQYAFKDNQDLLAMAVLQISTDLFTQNRQIETETKVITDKITGISEKIESFYLQQ